MTLNFKITLLCAITTFSLHAQDVVPDKWMPNGDVNAIARQGDIVYVGGEFSQVARSNPNGIIFNTQTLEINHNTSIPVATVTRAIPDHTGGFFVAPGSMFTNNGYRARRFAHIYADGSLSPTFNPRFPVDDVPIPSSGKWISMLTATTDRVFFVTRYTENASVFVGPYVTTLHCVDYNGNVIWSRNLDHWIISALVHNATLYLAGQFNSIENLPRPRLAALDIHSGAILPFNTGPIIPQMDQLPQIPNFPNTSQNAITMGVHENELIIRYRSTNIAESAITSVDLVSGTPTGWLMPVPTNLTNANATMLVHHGKIYLSNVTDIPLLVLDATTKQTLNAPGLNLPSPNSHPINCITSVGNVIYISSRHLNDENGNSNFVSRFDATTNEVLPLNLASIQTANAGFNIYFLRALTGSANNLYVGGELAGVGTEPRRNFFAFNTLTNELLPLSLNFGSTGGITDLYFSEGRLYIKGTFTELNGEARQHGFAAIDSNTGELLDWNPQIIPAEAATTAHLYAQGNSVYIYGEFTSVDGNPRAGIAGFDGTDGTLLDWNPEGMLEVVATSADANGVYIAGRNLTNSANAIHFYSRSTGAALFPPINYPAVTQTSSTSPGIMRKIEASEGTLYLAGGFQWLSQNGVEYPRLRFGAIDLSTGSITDAQATFPIASTSIQSMSVSGGTVYFAANYTDGVPRHALFSWDNQTNQLTAWGSRVSNLWNDYSRGFVHKILSYADGVYVGGNFAYLQTKSGYSTIFNFAKLTPDRSNRITGRVFYDLNQNGIQDAGEAGIPNTLVGLQPGNIYYSTNADGEYTMFSEAGDFTVEPVLPGHAVTSSPSARNITFTNLLQVSPGNDFAVTINPNVTDISTVIVADQEPRPGFFYNYFITYKNDGTAPSDGLLELQLDPRLIVQSTSIATTTAVDNTFSFLYSNMLPGESRSVSVRVRVPVPTVENNLMGQTLTATATVTPINADVDNNNNQDAITQTVIGSFDPNDKQVEPIGIGSNGFIPENTQHLDYTVRFQNLGTAAAEFVTITDVLSEHLDVSSFTFLGASHPNTYQIVNGTLTVTFDDIQLPPANMDEPGSHGFFQFRINLNESLAENTRIENQASIVFDYNPPVETNVVVNTLLDPPYDVTIFLPDSIGERNTEILYPIMVRDFQNILGAQFSINWDPNVATLETVEGFGLAGIDLNAFNLELADEGQLTFVWSNPTATAASLPDTSALFFIRFNLSGNFGASTIVSISHYPTPIEAIAESYQTIDIVRFDGFLEINPNFVLQGRVMYPNDEGVQAVAIGLTGSTTAEAITDAEGNFSFTIQPTGENPTYTITPAKSDDPNLLNGIDVQDVALIRRHVLRTETFNSPFAFIAADVSNNSDVSVQDLVILQALILQVEDNFPNNRQWAFAAASHEFEATNSPFSFPQAITHSLDPSEPANFTGIKIGDVNISRDNTQAGRGSVQEVVLEISQPTEMANGVVEFNIRSFGFIDIAAYQFTLQWNAEQLRFIETVTNDVTPQFGSHRVPEGFLTTLWDDPNGQSQSLSENASLMKIRFEKVGQGDFNNVSIAGTLTPIKMYDENLRDVSVSIRESEEEKIESGFFYPNPFIEKTKISFSSNEAQTAVFNVIDAMGRQKQLSEIAIQKGWNEIVYDGTALSEGVYIFKLQLKDKQVKAKIIKRKD